MFRTGRKKELRDVIVLEFCCFCTDATTKILTVETSLSVLLVFQYTVPLLCNKILVEIPIDGVFWSTTLSFSGLLIL